MRRGDQSYSENQKWKPYEADLMDLWERCVSCLKQEEVEWVAMTMRKLWPRRNGLIFEDKFIGPKELGRAVKAKLEEFYEAQQLVKKFLNQNITAEGSETRWRKRTGNYVKVNWDAAMDMNAMRTGLGVVIRDSKGDLLLFLSANKRFSTNPLIAESMALWRAMEVCQDMGFSAAIFEGDAQTKVRDVYNYSENWTSYGKFQKELRDMLKKWPL
ncbi:hypothetical protein F2P56_036012 [Juglans regia]|uniref:RNase H type-1 domain-containing protein n=2 Tax=Juglans regia TaxID=51240 RepID=A0A833TQ88_JUGRE|nr:uncharacterized protein LOC109019887 [Juglans regia]KAF5443458.1 hypothetical protein F2P56_036012 [Juglans regia]